MDAVHTILLDALRMAAGHTGELRLHRSGKLPGLFPARSSAHTQAATRAVQDSLIKVVRTETRGKTVVEFVRVTPRGVDFVLQHDSPARAMDELREALAVNAQHLPAWIAEVRREFDALSRRVADEMTRIGERLERVALQVEAALAKAEEERNTAPVPWTQAALDYLAGRGAMTGQASCPMPDLFAALGARQVDLSIRDFHTGLRRLQDDGIVRLLPHDAPPEPEFALPDGAALLYCVEMEETRKPANLPLAG